MHSIKHFVLEKKRFGDFIEKVMKNYDLIAPVESNPQKKVKRSYFTKISSAEQIYLDKKTYYPAKDLFFKTSEVILEFEGKQVKDPELDIRKRVIFGLRLCDLNSIWHQDMVFLEEHTDPFYKIRRDASLLIGYHCKEGDDYCFCNSFNLTEYFDLMFYDKGLNYGIEVGSQKGYEFIKKFGLKEKQGYITKEDKKIKNKKKLNSTDIAKDYNSKIWKKGSEECVSCGACNFLCPNCHCFEFEDEINMDLNTGKRIRKPASCQLRSFTRVAGDHIFRIEKDARFKHRIYHQIVYFKERHHVTFCTGCGRCIEGCPAKIDWVKIINEMKR